MLKNWFFDICLNEGVPKKGVARRGFDWTSLILKFFVGAIKPMDQLINTVGMNFEGKNVFWTTVLSRAY